MLELTPPSRAWAGLWIACLAVVVLGADPFTAAIYGGYTAVGVISIVLIYQLWILSPFAFRTQRTIGRCLSLTPAQRPTAAELVDALG